MEYFSDMERQCIEAFERGEYTTLKDRIEELRKEIEASKNEASDLA